MQKIQFQSFLTRASSSTHGYMACDEHNFFQQWLSSSHSFKKVRYMEYMTRWSSVSGYFALVFDCVSS